MINTLIQYSTMATYSISFHLSNFGRQVFTKKILRPLCRVLLLIKSFTIFSRVPTQEQIFATTIFVDNKGDALLFEACTYETMIVRWMNLCYFELACLETAFVFPVGWTPTKTDIPQQRNSMALDGICQSISARMHLAETHVSFGHWKGTKRKQCRSNSDALNIGSFPRKRVHKRWNDCHSLSQASWQQNFWFKQMQLFCLLDERQLSRDAVNWVNNPPEMVIHQPLCVTAFHPCCRVPKTDSVAWETSDVWCHARPSPLLAE